MMSPHMSKTSGALPATIAATSLFCQSSGVGWSVTLPIFSLLSSNVGRTLAVPAIQKSLALICHSSSVLPLPWTVRLGRGVFVGEGAPAAACAGACVGAAVAAAAGAVVAAAAGAVVAAGAGAVVAAAAGFGASVGFGAAAGALVGAALWPQAANSAVPRTPTPAARNRRRAKTLTIPCFSFPLSRCPTQRSEQPYEQQPTTSD